MTHEQKWRQDEWDHQLPEPASQVTYQEEFYPGGPDTHQPQHTRVRDVPLGSKLAYYAKILVFSLRRALMPALLIAALIFAASTYVRIQTVDTKITLAHVRAQYAVRFGQPGAVIAFVDKRNQVHRFPAKQLSHMRHVSELARTTRSRLMQNAALAAGIGLLWLLVSTYRTARRLL